ncbi:DUF373 family protein [Haloarculaceae archaeon H-GB2-1]|nr:DUF373 family protein [Haloarculaceae archaeon H-GB2-1]
MSDSATDYAEQVRAYRERKDEAFRDERQSPLPAADRETFEGLNYYPPDEDYRFVVPLHEHDEKETVVVGTSTEGEREYVRWGEFRVEIGGEDATIQAYKSDPDDDRLWVPFRDATSGDETYGAGRYIDLEPDHRTEGASGCSTSISRTIPPAPTPTATSVRCRRPRTGSTWPSRQASNRSTDRKQICGHGVALSDAAGTVRRPRRRHRPEDGRGDPVVGRDAVEDAAVALATADPEDSDVNVLFEGVHIHDDVDDEAVEVAAVTGVDGSDVAANRAVGEELDEVLATLSTGEDVRALVVTDGAQDESVIPVIRSRVTIDGVRRVVVRQAQDLESMYYTIKQVLDDPETRGTILVPMGILLLIYPLAILADTLGMPGAVFGLTSGLLGMYMLFRGLGIEENFDDAIERVRSALFTGRVTLITYVVASALLVIGGVNGVETLTSLRTEAAGALGVLEIISALILGAIPWFAAAGVTSSLGRVTDEYLSDEFEWGYLNAPVYVVAIAAILDGVSSYFLGHVGLSYLALVLTGGTLLGLFSTLTFAIAESRFGRRADPA